MDSKTELPAKTPFETHMLVQCDGGRQHALHSSLKKACWKKDDFMSPYLM